MSEIEQSDVLSLPVGGLEDHAKIGIVKSIIVNPDNGYILGIIVGTGPIYLHTLFASWQDIKDITPEAVVIQSSDALLQIADVVRAHELIKDDFGVINLPVETRDGRRLGRVNDYSINTKGGYLSKLEVTSFIGPSRIISKKSIIKITPSKVIVRSNLAKQLSKDLVSSAST